MMDHVHMQDRQSWEEEFIKELGYSSLNRLLFRRIDDKIFKGPVGKTIQTTFRSRWRNTYYGDIVDAKSCEGTGLGLSTMADQLVVKHLREIGLDISLPVPYWPKPGCLMRERLDARTDAERQIEEEHHHFIESPEGTDVFLRTKMHISLASLDRSLKDPRIRHILLSRLAKYTP